MRVDVGECQAIRLVGSFFLDGRAIVTGQMGADSFESEKIYIIK